MNNPNNHTIAKQWGHVIKHLNSQHGISIEDLLEYLMDNCSNRDFEPDDIYNIYRHFNIITFDRKEETVNDKS